MNGPHLEDFARQFITDVDAMTESIRVAKVRSLQVLYNGHEEIYDDIVQIAAELFETKSAVLTFIDEDKAYIKANARGEIGEERREDAFCNITIKNPTAPLVIEDARQDDRLKTNPKVLKNDVIFYAGVPIINEGYAVGALCVIDDKPRQITDHELELLQKMGKIVNKVVVAKPSTTPPAV